MRQTGGATAWIRVFAASAASLAMSGATSADPVEPLKNHYNDPFVQVTNAIKACPQPRGPFMTVKEAQAEAHPRIERGTTCFMSDKCTEPNAYRYDARIATAAQAATTLALKQMPALAQSSVWFTVQRRFVFVHGCVARRGDVAKWERILKAVPDVEYVGVDLAVGKSSADFARVPYPVMRR
jgi:hypothetical protein